LRERIKQLEIEEQALKKEKDKASKERIDKIKADLSDLKEKSSVNEAALGAGERSYQRYKELKEEIEKTRLSADQAERDADLAKAAELRLRQTP